MKTVEALLRTYPADIQALTQSARALLRRLFPDIDESVDGAARMVAYSCGPGYAGMVCTLILSQSGVKLGLARGAELDDPRRLLTGSGKVHRHIQLRTAADLRAPGVSPLIKAAYVAARKRTGASGKPPSSTR